jgi:hypothetical protein
MTRPAIDVALCDDEIPEQTRLRGILGNIFERVGFDAKITTYNSLADLVKTMQACNSSRGRSSPIPRSCSR